MLLLIDNGSQHMVDGINPQLDTLAQVLIQILSSVRSRTLSRPGACQSQSRYTLVTKEVVAPSTEKCMHLANFVFHSLPSNVWLINQYTNQVN